MKAHSHMRKAWLIIIKSSPQILYNNNAYYRQKYSLVVIYMIADPRIVRDGKRIWWYEQLPIYMYWVCSMACNQTLHYDIAQVEYMHVARMCACTLQFTRWHLNVLCSYKHPIIVCFGDQNEETHHLIVQHADRKRRCHAGIESNLSVSEVFMHVRTISIYDFVKIFWLSPSHHADISLFHNLHTGFCLMHTV